MRSRSLLVVLGLALNGCGGRAAAVRPSIEITRVPPADKGGPDTLDLIEGRVTGARPGQRVVLFAKSRVWWVQPDAKEPFTEVQKDSRWKSPTHLGTEYAALLVEPDYRPPLSTEDLPREGAGIVAATVVPGDSAKTASHRTIGFSGYDWLVRAAPSDRGGRNAYDPANAWTDAEGAMHLRIAGKAPDWTCAEVSLARRLGYGSYRFVMRDVAHLEPAAVLSMFTWDGAAADQNHREMDIEISRWGDPAAKNAQYVIQPYYVAANIARFTAPPGVVTHTLRWAPGRVTLRTDRGSVSAAGARPIAEHVFTSGVPTPGNETVRMNLYVFRRSVAALERGTEVVIEKFEYLP
jgi:hypothetical protein